MKKTAKQNTKKPLFIVDLTNIERGCDVSYEFSKAKIRAGIAINKNEFDAIVYKTYIDAVNSCDAVVACFMTYFAGLENNAEKQKKTPWYKKISRWLFKK